MMFVEVVAAVRGVRGVCFEVEKIVFRCRNVHDADVKDLWRREGWGEEGVRDLNAGVALTYLELERIHVIRKPTRNVC